MLRNLDCGRKAVIVILLKKQEYAIAIIVGGKKNEMSKLWNDFKTQGMFAL